MASADRDESLSGTASTVRAFVLLEHNGPWGTNAPRDARMPDGLGERIDLAARAAGVRVLLARRPDRYRSTVDGHRLLAAYPHPTRSRLEGTTLHSLGDVLDLDLGALRQQGSLGLPALHGPVFGVCTHGRHDACCAELGRPVAAALAERHPEETWEVTHIGGDRFAGNMVVLPQGLYYGRMTPAAAVTVADEVRAGRLELEHLRGRTCLAMPVQAAEIALRRRLDVTEESAVRVTGRSVEDEVTRATFRAGDREYAVRVRTTRGPERSLLTCRADRDNPLPHHEVLDITAVA